MATDLTQDQPIDSFDSYLERMERKRADRLRIAPNTAAEIRAILFPVLAAEGIAEVVVRYDGYGDQGNIEEIDLYNAKGEPFAADNAIWNAHIYTAADPRWTDRAFGGRVRLVLEEIADWLLELHVDGYEDGEGGYGEVRLDAVDGTISHAHSQRRHVTDDERFDL
jgi:hypothetical protein